MAPGRDEELALLRRRSELNSLQIDEIQVQLAKAAPAKKWYKESSSLIAAAALAVSLAGFGTTLVTDYQDQHDKDHARITQIVAEINKINTDTSLQIAQLGDKAPPASNTAGTRQALCNEALALIDSSGATPDQMTTIADDFFDAGDSQKADILARRVVNQSEDNQSAVRGHRTLGRIAFQLDRIDEARAEYGHALRRLDGDPSVTPLDHKAYDAYTEVEWARGEVSRGQCAAARDHVGRARAVMASENVTFVTAQQLLITVEPAVNACV